MAGCIGHETWTSRGKNGKSGKVKDGQTIVNQAEEEQVGYGRGRITEIDRDNGGTGQLDQTRIQGEIKSETVDSGGTKSIREEQAGEEAQRRGREQTERKKL